MTEHEKWLRIAKLAGEHGVRYRTNAALEAFLAAIADGPAPPGTTRAPADLRSALEAETIERCARVAEDHGAAWVEHQGFANVIATAIRALAPTKGDVS